MKTFLVDRADLLGSEPVEPTRLDIVGDLSDLLAADEPMAAAKAHFIEQASIVRDALRALPQGTKHQLLILLLQDSESLYRGTPR